MGGCFWLDLGGGVTTMVIPSGPHFFGVLGT